MPNDVAVIKPVGEAISSHAQGESEGFRPENLTLTPNPQALLNQPKWMGVDFSYLYSPHLQYSPHLLYPYGKFPGIYPTEMEVLNI